MLDEEKKVVQKSLQDLNGDQVFKALINFKFDKPLEEYEFFQEYLNRIKSIDFSEEARLKGNQLFTGSDHNSSVHYNILKSYNESIANAPLNSEMLAVAYSNKSAILLHICKYREAITEIDKAFKITKSTALKVKLLCRRAKCLTSLGSSENSKHLVKARFLLNKFEGEEQVKENLGRMIDVAEKFVKGVSSETMKLYKENAKLSKKISKAEISCDPSLEIVYSEEYGRHLIATRDIKPGEIILVEETVSTVHPEQIYAYCGHCNSFLWEIVPCDYCANISFCSESCKLEAWEQYHDVECAISVFLLLFHKGTHSLHPQIGLKILITAIRQAGSIHALKNSLESLEKRKDKFTDFSTTGKYIDYRHVYALTYHLKEIELAFLSNWSVINLLTLAKFPSPIQKFFTLHSFDLLKLLNNKDVLFLGALLLKFCAISATHSVQAVKVEHDLSFPINIQHCLETGCCTKFIAFGVRTNLANFACMPNVRKCPIENNRIILYAIQPIKKGEQIFDSRSSILGDIPKHERQKAHKERTGSHCKCLVCEQDWPVMNLLGDPYEGLNNLSPRCHEVLCEIKSVLSKYRDQDALSTKTLSKFSKIVEDMVEHSPLPSKLTALSMNCLSCLMEVCHGFQNKPRIPHQCSL